MQQEFDAIALEYDAVFSHTAVGQAMRKRVWRLLEQVLPAESENFSVLEINCGTGEDALWLAKRGYSVLATDISPEMVGIAGAKAARAGTLIRTQVCSIEALNTLPVEAFDVVFSNFGGLNCLDGASMAAFAAQLQKRLKPEGRFIAVVMGKCCFWEILYYLLKGKPRQAFRRFGKQPLSVTLQDGTPVKTWYYSPNQFQKHFSGFICEKLAPVGITLPPSYLAPFFEKRPRFLHWLYLMEYRLSGKWTAKRADHFLISMRKIT